MASAIRAEIAESFDPSAAGRLGALPSACGSLLSGRPTAPNHA